MPNPGLPIVLRILDNENRLSERADQKSISLLSILGVFMVFFIVYYRVIPMNLLTVSLILLYFIFALMSIISLIMAIRPRIRKQPGETIDAKIAAARDPAFFTGINQAKYKFVQRGVMLVIITLVIELTIITYLFTYHMSSGLDVMPPIN